MARRSQRTVKGDGATSSHLRARERGRVRRRLRRLRALRELQLRDLGGLVFDLYRFGRQRDPLVREKLETLAQTDRESRDLESMLGEREPAREVRQPGVGGACPECGELYASDARFCSACGILLDGDAAAVAEAALATGQEPQEQGTLFYAQSTEEQAAIVPEPEPREPEEWLGDEEATTKLPAVEAEDRPAR